MVGFQLLVYFQMYLKRKAMNIYSYFDIDIVAVVDQRVFFYVVEVKVLVFYVGVVGYFFDEGLL